MTLRSPREEAGFTLVELMVVILIIAILIAIAVPTFIGYRQRAADVAAKQSAVLAVKTARSVENDGTYTGVTSADLAASQPGMTFVDGATMSTGPNVVSHESLSADVLVASVFSTAQKCFFIRDDLTAGTNYGSIVPATAADCTAGNFGVVVFGGSW